MKRPPTRRTACRLRWLGTTALLALAALACFQKLARHPGDLLVSSYRQGRNDLTSYFVASCSYPAFQRQWSPQAPFWNPHRFAGAPHVGNPQSALYYPLNWAGWWTASPSWISWSLVVHHWLAAVGTVLLCRLYRWSQLASCTAGMLFLASPFLLAHTAEGHYTLVCAAAWVPWAFWAFERLRQGRRWALVSLVAVLALCFFAGHMQTVYYLVVVLSCLRLADVVRLLFRSQARRAVAAATQWCWLGLLTLMLVAVDLLPMWFYAQHTLRGGGLTAVEASASSIALTSLWQLFDPSALGGPHSYRGPGIYYWETLCYFGVGPLVLAAVGLAAGWRRSHVRQAAVVCLVALLFAAGTRAWVFPLCYQYLPGCSLFRVPSRGLLFSSLCLALLAGSGICHLQRFAARARQNGAHARLSPALGLGLLLALTMVVVGLAARRPGLGGELAHANTPPSTAALAGANFNASDSRLPRATDDASSVPPWIWPLAMLGGMAVLATRPAKTRWAVSGITVLCLLELVYFGQGLLATIPPGSLRQHSPLAQWLAQQPGAFRVSAPQDLLSDREAWSSGIQKMQAYDPLPPALHLLATVPLTQMDPQQRMQRIIFGFSALDPAQVDPRLLDLMNVRFAVQPLGQAAPGTTWTCRTTGTIQAPHALRDRQRNSGEFAIYENPHVLPRTFVLGEVRSCADGDAALEHLTRFDPRQELLLAEDVLPAGPRQAFTPARIVHYAPNEVIVQVRNQRPGYLYLGDAWYPGWKASDNGKPLPILRANVAFRAVPLEAGVHRVTFRYQPPGLVVGRWISFVAAMGLLVWGLACYRGTQARRGNKG